MPCYFFSPSVCVYRDVQSDEPPLTEDDAIPANPDNEYGWEKLYAKAGSHGLWPAARDEGAECPLGGLVWAN